MSEEERTTLIEIRDRDARAYMRERASALLQIAAGTPAYHVAASGLLRPRHQETVYAWLNAYEASRSVPEHKPRRRRFFPSG